MRNYSDDRVHSLIALGGIFLVRCDAWINRKYGSQIISDTTCPECLDCIKHSVKMNQWIKNNPDKMTTDRRRGFGA